MPYLVQILISVLISSLSGAWYVGAGYYLGIMSHPIHGWLVNSLAHSYGYRNFKTKDHSTNNTLVSLLVFGEGLQNNHHARPKSPNFAKKFGEIDFGYWVCVCASKIGFFSLKNDLQPEVAKHKF